MSFPSEYKRAFFAFSLLVFFAAFPAFAASLKVGESYTLQTGEDIKDNLYTAAGILVLSGTMRGDAAFAAGDATVSGIVSGDMLFAAGSSEVLGEVLGDVRGAGGKITIAKHIGGDAMLVGGLVSVVPGVLIGGDAAFIGGRISLLGDVSGSVSLVGQDIFIDGKTVGNVHIISSGRVRLGPNAVIGGDFSYRSSEQAIIDPGAQIKGKTTFTYLAPVLTSRNVHGFFAGLFGLALVFRLLMLLAAALLFALSFRKMTGELSRFSVEHFWKSMLIGLIVLVVAPFASVIIALTVFGALVSVALILAWLSLVLLAEIYAGIIFANAALKFIFKKELPPVVSWKTVAIGTIALGALFLVPYIGPLVCLAFFLVSLGALSHLFYRYIILAR